LLPPKKTYIRLASRSGLAAAYNIHVAGELSKMDVDDNCSHLIIYFLFFLIFYLAGVVDRDYRGNIQILLLNHSSQDFHVTKGARIAQAIIEKIVDADVLVVQVRLNNNDNVNFELQYFTFCRNSQELHVETVDLALRVLKDLDRMKMETQVHAVPAEVMQEVQSVRMDVPGATKEAQVLLNQPINQHQTNQILNHGHEMATVFYHTFHLFS
jgi:hypothetical protein